MRARALGRAWFVKQYIELDRASLDIAYELGVSGTWVRGYLHAAGIRKVSLLSRARIEARVYFLLDAGTRFGSTRSILRVHDKTARRWCAKYRDGFVSFGPEALQHG